MFWVPLLEMQNAQNRKCWENFNNFGLEIIKYDVAGMQIDLFFRKIDIEFALSKELQS